MAIKNNAGAISAQLLCVNPTNGAVLRDEPHRIDPGLAKAYRDYFSTKDILRVPMLNTQVGEPTPDYKLVSMRDWEQSELFNELAMPYELPKQPISILVSPVPRKTQSWIAGDPRWMLLVFDPERRTPVSIELIARDLGISSREAEVAALLAVGYDLHHIGLRLSISENTVRTHLKAIFSKTGIHSQSELVRRIASGPSGKSRVTRK